jgi:hypothetical protein
MLAPFGDTFVLLAATFLGAIVSAFAGFAFAPVAGVVMLGALAPQQLVPLLMLCSVPVQIATLFHLRRTRGAGGTGAMLLGGAAGVPLAIFLLNRIDAHGFRLGFGLFLAAYAAVMLLRPAAAFASGRPPRRAALVGFLGGLVGGLTAMPGAIPVLWCDLRGLAKEAQRRTVQPFILAMQLFALAVMAASGGLDRAVLGLAATSLPALAAGTAVGLTLFGRMPDALFRRAVLVLLALAGAGTAMECLSAP